MRPDYLLGLDLGQSNDYTALCVAEKRAAPGVSAGYDVSHLDRWRGMPYTALPARLEAVVRRIRRAKEDADFAKTGVVLDPPSVALVVDQTGVGAAVVDLLRDAGLSPIPVVIHGGDAVSRGTGGEYRVPKRELAGTVGVLLEARRLRVAERLAETPALLAELRNFRATIGLAGHDAYGAGDDWREGNHDDLVLAVALACWYGERAGTVEAMPDEFGAQLANWRGV